MQFALYMHVRVYVRSCIRAYVRIQVYVNFAFTFINRVL